MWPHYEVSHSGIHPFSSEVQLFQNPMFLWSRGLLRARSRFPHIVENNENVVEGMEQLDGAVELAKHVNPRGRSLAHPAMTWVQVWVQLENEKWLPISRKRHQIGQLDLRSFRLLTEGLQVRILPGEPILAFLRTWMKLL